VFADGKRTKPPTDVPTNRLTDRSSDSIDRTARLADHSTAWSYGNADRTTRVTTDSAKTDLAIDNTKQIDSVGFPLLSPLPLCARSTSPPSSPRTSIHPFPRTERPTKTSQQYYFRQTTHRSTDRPTDNSDRTALLRTERHDASTDSTNRTALPLTVNAPTDRQHRANSVYADGQRTSRPTNRPTECNDRMAIYRRTTRRTDRQ